MPQRSSDRQLQLLRDVGLWQQHHKARSASSVYLSDQDTQADARLSRYRDYLGHEFEQVWIDCSNGLHADAIAALCGTITAGGLLTVLLPENNNAMSQRMEYFAAKFYPNSTDHETGVLRTALLSSDDDFQLTAEQKVILTALFDTKPETAKENVTHIITAERGRGKSTLLGQTLARAKNPGSIVVTAPRKANAKILMQYAPQAKFVAWDKLLEQPDSPGTKLIIDEAAGLPLWATEKLCQKFTPWLLATTVAGYEGCGRGFAVHFTDWAQKNLPKVSIHQLTQPLRWPLNDPLEQWLTETFLLNEQAVADSTETISGTFIKHASELSEGLLQPCFQLLLNAHYQSSPNDLNLLLTEPGHRLAYQYENDKIIAVAWLMNEGPVNSPLKHEIQQGRRRPKGNLLPQAVGYFLQQKWAMDLRWLRVARIAVPADRRRRKAASTLLTNIRQWAQKNHYHMLGTSFAWSADLDKFWQKNNYQPWRFGSRIDSVSARPAAIYVQPLAQSLVSTSELINSWGLQQLHWLSKGKEALSSTKGLGDIRTNIIEAYTSGILPFDAAHFALAQWFYWWHGQHALAELLCQPGMTLKQLGQYWGGLSQRQANENLCKEVLSRY